MEVVCKMYICMCEGSVLDLCVKVVCRMYVCVKVVCKMYVSVKVTSFHATPCGFSQPSRDSSPDTDAPSPDPLIIMSSLLPPLRRQSIRNLRDVTAYYTWNIKCLIYFSVFNIFVGCINIFGNLVLQNSQIRYHRY